MAKHYEFFDHTADIGVDVYGGTLAELFGNAARALYEAAGRFQRKSPGADRILELSADGPEYLMHDWLAELLYDLSTHRIWYDRVEISRIHPASLTARLRGGEVDFARSEISAEIKAVTYHQLGVEQRPGGRWHARIILDV